MNDIGQKPGIVDSDDDSPETLNLRTLWRSVLAQGIRDLASTDTSLVLETWAWLGTDDWITVCDLAAFDHEWLEKEVRRICYLENPYRKHFLNELSAAVNIGLTQRGYVEEETA